MNELQPNQNREQENKERLRLNILFAEDDKAVKNMIKIMLEHLGHTVTMVDNGQELLDKLRAFKNEEFTFVFTDNNMPKLDGLEAIKQFRTDERFKDLPFILYTGLPDPTIQETVNGLKGLMLVKPLEFGNLSSDITEAVRKAEAV